MTATPAPDVWDLVVAKLTSKYATHPGDIPGYHPQPKQQQAQDLADTVFELLYGGAAGGGKSYWLRHDAVRYCLRHPGAYVAIVRRTLPMLKKTHWRPLQDICTGLAHHNKSDLTWTFANGAVLQLISLTHDGDEQDYKSVEFDRLYFDELTEFTEGQYTYMLSRLRSGRGHPVAAIGATNPEGVGFSWVKRRWVKPRPGDLADGQAAPAPYEVWQPLLPDGSGFARARAFIPATVLDNPALLSANPDYEVQLRSISDPRKRKALLEGDWNAMDQVPGALFSLAVIDAHRWRDPTPPPLARVVVAVDPAATHSDDSDDTGIVVAGLKPGPTPHFYVLADRSVHLDPDGWARAAIQAYLDHDANDIVVEGNQGGEMTRSTLLNAAKAMRREGLIDHLPSVHRVTAKVGKRLRADPAAVLYNAGQVHHVGEHTELEEQMTTWIPESGHDSPDRMDALVWALARLDKRGTEPTAPLQFRSLA